MGKSLVWICVSVTQGPFNEEYKNKGIKTFTARPTCPQKKAVHSP